MFAGDRTKLREIVVPRLRWFKLGRRRGNERHRSKRPTPSALSSGTAMLPCSSLTTGEPQATIARSYCLLTAIECASTQLYVQAGRKRSSQRYASVATEPLRNACVASVATACRYATHRAQTQICLRALSLLGRATTPVETEGDEMRAREDVRAPSSGWNG